MTLSQYPADALTPAQESVLDGRLMRLRDAASTLNAPPQVEAALISAFRLRRARSKIRHWREFVMQWFAPGIALAASAGMSAWMVLAPMARPVAHPPADLITDLASADTPFIALQSLEQIAMEPRLHVIETSIPRMWLASYGIAISPDTAAESMRAEVLVSANGQPLAMRFRP